MSWADWKVTVILLNPTTIISQAIILYTLLIDAKFTSNGMSKKWFFLGIRGGEFGSP